MTSELTRRNFLKRAALGTAALPVLMDCLDGSRCAASEAPDETRYIREAMHWRWEDERTIRCGLCPHACLIEEDMRGDCAVRQWRKIDGEAKYATLVYGRACAVHIDPIEKKPLFHFLPSSRVLSVATAGCNFTCKFCQNWNISQSKPEEIRSRFVSPQGLVRAAKLRKTPSIAFTYSEPVVFYEYMHDTAKLGRDDGIRTVMISNGFINAAPMKELCKHLAAVKVDFKGFSEKFYRDVCGGSLKPVLETMKLIVEEEVPLELVTLLIPGLNDSDKELSEMARWIVKHLGPDVPCHFTRFTPQYKMLNTPATPLKTLERAREIMVAEGVHYAYVGNVAGHKYESTYCPKCGEALVKRYAYYIRENRVKNGKCPECGTDIPGVWS